MEVPERRLMVYPTECAGLECTTCASAVCSLCQHCLTDKSIAQLRDAYLEHVNRQECKRIFPPKMVSILLIGTPRIGLYNGLGRMLCY